MRQYKIIFFAPSYELLLSERHKITYAHLRRLSRFYFASILECIEEERVVDKNEFSVSRKRLGKTQKQLAELLGMALKTVHSYEQGWRKIPSHIERQMFFLLCKQRSRHKTLVPCWEKKQCDLKLECPAWEFQSGHLCWFISGTRCEEVQGLTNEEKVEKCKSCEILGSLLAE